MKRSKEFKEKLRARLVAERKELSETVGLVISMGGGAVAVAVKGATGLMLGVAIASTTIWTVALGAALTCYALQRKNAIRQIEGEFKPAS